MTGLAEALWLAVAVAGLALPVLAAGLPLLGQGAFVAVGGFGTVLLAEHLPLPAAVVLAVSAATLLGLAVAAAAARLDGAPLGLATWGLAWLVVQVLQAFPGTFGGSQGLVRPAPAVLDSPLLGTRWVLGPEVHAVLAGGVLLCLALGWLRADRGPGGADLAALRGGPALAASLGVPVGRRRRAVVMTAAGLGGLSGAGTAVLLGVVSAADVSALLSLQLAVAVVLGGALVGASDRPRGARLLLAVAVGSVVLALLPRAADGVGELLGVDVVRARGALTALLLVLALVLRRLLGRRSMPRPAQGGTGVTALEEWPPSTPAPPARSPGAVLLEARGLTVSFGAVPALAGVDLTLRSGEVHALVGPNGSGKSTLLRVLAGAQSATGTLAVGQVPVPLRRGRLPADEPARVARGVVRTPQATVLAAGLGLAEQVAVGVRGGAPRRFAVLRHLLATPQGRAAAALATRRTAGALRRVDLPAPPLEVATSALATGQVRRLQVARAAATGAPVLLLDEPAAGTTAAERATLVEVLRRLRDRGDAVLLVEHDLRLVGEVADRVTVLDAGRVVASGTVGEVRQDPAVRRAYLGEDV